LDAAAHAAPDGTYRTTVLLHAPPVLPARACAFTKPYGRRAQDVHAGSYACGDAPLAVCGALCPTATPVTFASITRCFTALF